MDVNDDLEIRDELAFVIEPEEAADWRLISDAVSWCAVHHSRECSPSHNNCGLLDQQRKALQRQRPSADVEA